MRLCTYRRRTHIVMDTCCLSVRACVRACVINRRGRRMAFRRLYVWLLYTFSMAFLFVAQREEVAYT